MKNVRIPVSLPILLLASSSLLAAGTNQWTSTGPPGENITSVAVAPSNSSVIYVGTTSGQFGSAFKSLNAGTSWTPLPLPSPATYPASAPVVFGVSPTDPDVVWLSCPSGVFSSSDGGGTWESSFFINPPVNVFAMQDSGVLWVGTPNGLTRIADGNVLLNSGNFPQYRNVTAVVFDPADSSIVYVCADHLYRSPDGGESWQELDDSLAGSPALATAIDPSDSSKLYLGRTDGLYRSTNGGNSWDGPAAGTAGLSIASIAIDPSNASVLDAAGPGGGLLSSTDSGASWTSNPALCPTSLAFSIIDPSDHTHLIAAGPSGYYDSPDSGSSWSLVEPGSPALDVVAVALDPADGSHVYAATAASGLWSSPDGGATWDSLCDPAIDPRLLSIAVSNSSPSTIYVGTETGVFKTTNGGANWTSAGLAGDRIAALAVDPTDATHAYAGIGGGLDSSAFYRTTDSGSNWQPDTGGMAPGATVEAIAVDPVTPSTVYVGEREPAYADRVLKSTDAGSTFSPTAIFDVGGIESIAIDPSDPSTLFIGGVFTLFRSRDGGGTFLELSPNGITENASVAFDPTSPATVYVADSAGVSKTNDGGDTWMIYPGMPASGASLRSVVVDPDLPSRIYGGFRNGGAAILDQATPTVSSIDPPTGNTVGGLLATIHGTGFMPGLDLIFDGASLTPLSVTDTAITIVTPPHPVAFVDVQVIDPTFLGATLASGFEYVCSAPFTAIVHGTQTICPGNNADIDVFLSGVPPWTLHWHDGETDETTESPFRRTVSPGVGTTYFLDSVSDSSGCGAGSPSGSAVITVSTPPPAPVITAPLTVPADATNVAASVPLHPGNDDFWNLSNAWQTGGGITNAITFTPWAPGVTVDLQVSEWDLSGTRCFTATADRLVQVDFLDVPEGAPFHDFVDAIAEHGVTNGCGNGNYCPNRRLARQEMAAFIARAAVGTPPDSGLIGAFAYDCVNGPSYFADVPVGSLFCAAIHYLAAQKLTLGCSPQHFCPSLLVTREQMALFIGRAIAPSATPPPAYSDGGTGRSYDCSVAAPFPDVAANTESCNAIGYIWAKGIVDGFGDGTFHPNDALTRAPAAKFIANAFGLTLGP